MKKSDLIKIIKEIKEKDSNGVKKTNEGGWHSQTDLHFDERFSTLKSEIIILRNNFINTSNKNILLILLLLIKVK